MPCLKFCCNISWMFKEHDFLDRYRLAAEAGFKGVEAAFPYDVNLESMVEAKEDSGLTQVLINSGDIQSLGHAAVPNKENVFDKELDLAISYATALKCQRIHLMAGKHSSCASKTNDNNAEYKKTFMKNLTKASDKLKKISKNGQEYLGMIEFINNKKGLGPTDYFLNDAFEGESIVKELKADNIKLQVDLFHLQVMNGNLTQNITHLLPVTGHMQISQVPIRNEPDASGEISYDYIFQLLNDLGYKEWIGCEYKPTGSTQEGLKWFKHFIE